MSAFKTLSAFALAAAAALALPSFVSADPLFSDPGESGSKYTVIQESLSNDSSAAFNVDYAALGIPEATHHIAGSAAQRGIQLIANKNDSSGNITGINVLLGATPETFTGTHTLQFDVWMNAPSGAASTTEGFLGGTGRNTSTDAIIRNFRTGRGNGAWFYLAGDNGNNTDDFRMLDNGTSKVVFADTDAASAPKFNAAFTDTLVTGGAKDADNEWVQVSVVQDGTTASVYLNGVLFGTETSTNTSGFAWFGYEDFFASVGSPTLYGIFDNVTVVQGDAVNAPEPTSLAALGVCGLLFGRRRRRA